MPHADTSGGILGTLLSAAPELVRAFFGGGGQAPITGIAPSVARPVGTVPIGPGGAVLTPALNLPFRDITPEGRSALFEPFRKTCDSPLRFSARKFIGINPASGRVTWFGPMGTPLVWSGDIAAKRRVERFAGKFARRARRGGR